jgi:hypothetical protein
MAKGIAIFFGFIIAYVIGILVMIHGWGLEPQSWWIIIGGGVFIKLIVETMTAIAKESK